MIFRQPISSCRVWLALLFVNFFNEFVDLWIERWPDPARQYGQGMKDLLLTMTIPTILILVARFAPRLLVRQAEEPKGLRIEPSVRSYRRPSAAAASRGQ